MATYCTVAELGTKGVNPEAIEDIDPQRKLEAIASTSDYMDGFFKSQAVLPLVSWGDDVRECCAVLAAAKLMRVRGSSYNSEDPFWLEVARKERWLLNISRRDVTPQWVTSAPAAKLGVPDGGPKVLSAPSVGFSSMVRSPGGGLCGDRGGGSFGA